MNPTGKHKFLEIRSTLEKEVLLNRSVKIPQNLSFVNQLKILQQIRIFSVSKRKTSWNANLEHAWTRDRVEDEQSCRKDRDMEGSQSETQKSCQTKSKVMTSLFILISRNKKGSLISFNPKGDVYHARQFAWT